MNTTIPSQGKRPVNCILRGLFLMVMVGLIPLGLIIGCQSSMIYFPRPYPPGTVANWETRTQGKTVNFTCSQGLQQAFLQGNLQSPRNLWVVCGGNGTVALDWSEWLATNAPKEDAWLLFDMPGYGACEGEPNPGRITESLRVALPEASRQLGWANPPPTGRLRFFGHSLGSAVCLMAASEFGIQQGVMVAPFTSTMDMTKVVTGLPLGFLVYHRFDNAARLDELAARGPGQVAILHGSDDEVIPLSMSQTLVRTHPDIVRLTVVPEGRHNDIQDRHAAVLASALDTIGRSKGDSQTR
jgi:uncharacterized protein